MMRVADVVFVRIYITELSHQLESIIDYLRRDAKVRGISVFRAISGFGESGEHTASLLDLSLDLPLTIEFFDSKDKVEPAITYLNQTIKAKHIVFWDAKVNL